MAILDILRFPDPRLRNRAKPVEAVDATIAALVAYALVGPNRRLVLGPDSSLAPESELRGANRLNCPR